MSSNNRTKILEALNSAATVLDQLLKSETTLQAIEEAAIVMSAAIQQRGVIYACGNGGSMSDALHFVEELTGNFRVKRRPFPGIALGCDAPYLTCVGNDYGFHEIFARQLAALGRSGDVLLAITTSGTSANVIKAAEVAKTHGIKVVALTGKPDALITKLADISIVTPALQWSDRVQELHIKVIHILIELIEGLVV